LRLALFTSGTVGGHSRRRNGLTPGNDEVAHGDPEVPAASDTAQGERHLALGDPPGPSPGAAFLLSVPLHPSHWTAFDDFVRHRRRYQPEKLLEKLAKHGFSVSQSAVYGMQPKSSRLLDLGMWCLRHRRETAMWWYNHVFMPLAVRHQNKLAPVAGMIDTDRVDEILLVCAKDPRSAEGSDGRPWSSWRQASFLTSSFRSS
jgi:hypothetical protein